MYFPLRIRLQSAKWLMKNLEMSFHLKSGRKPLSCYKSNFKMSFPIKIRLCYQVKKHLKFIHSRIYKAPLQEIYSEAPPAQPWQYRSVLSNLQNALSLKCVFYLKSGYR